MTQPSIDSSAALPSVWSRWVQLLRSPVDAASLALFRIGLGIVMALEALDLCLPYPQAISMGGSPLETYFTGGDIRFHFPYEGFEWLPLLPKTWIHVVTGLLGVSSLLMAAGWKHRWTSGTACLCWIYLWTVESTRSYWQSHYYMEALALFLIVWTPASAVMSVDAWRARRNSKPSSNLVPFWPVLLLRGQLVIAYFYAGVAKINLDWLLDAVPVRWFLTEPHVTAPYAKWMPQSAFTMFESFVHSVPFAYFLSYTGLVFDLLIGFLFLFRRSRYLAMALMALFHLTNHFLIFENIGRFPLAGLATATIFLNTDWPRRFWRWVCHPRFSRPDRGWFWSGFIALPVVGGLLGWKAERTSLGTQGPPGSSLLTIARWTPMVVVGWLAWQAIIPLRHYFIAGDARFTYEGLSFSWRLKTDTRRGKVVEMQIKDEQIIPASGPNAGRVQWEQWKEAPVIYRKVKPEELAWDSLPELIVVAEPLVGDRIFYNHAARGAATTELEARRRVQRWWNDTYSRQPQSVEQVTAANVVMDAVSRGLRAAGETGEASRVEQAAKAIQALRSLSPDAPEQLRMRNSLRQLLVELRSWDAQGALLKYLRTLRPFPLERSLHAEAPLLWINDPALMQMSAAGTPLINPKQWKSIVAAQFASKGDERARGPDPLVVLVSELGPETRDRFPRFWLMDSWMSPGNLTDSPTIRWNAPLDLSGSKLNHVSQQAFYLRRYAVRVADLWEQEHGRRPGVYATTRVSMNGRPFQELVDPDVDLASVRVSWVRHNGWVRDLQHSRIPREMLNIPGGP